MMVTKEEIKVILSEILECPAEKILDDVPLLELGYDSLTFISTVVEIESKYDIEIRDSDLVLENFANVQSICETLKKYFEVEQPKLYKCVITDCDGVLWRGISGEAGIDNAYLDEMTNTFCEYLRSLRQKGILLSICSKNELMNIKSMLKNTVLGMEDFAIVETDVTDKADSISYILNEFGFSAENAVFIDDSEAELDYVQSKHPELTVVKADQEVNFMNYLVSLFATLPESDVIDRTAKYREQKEREKIHHRTSSPEEYNRILETTIICEKASNQDASRLSELSQRANRFNLTGVRYSMDDIAQMQNDSRCSIYKLCAEDKYGDMGLVAMSVVKGNLIESFVMSCRVFGRGFENILLCEIKTNCEGEMIGIYHPTGKNDYCKNFYTNCEVQYEIR